MACDEEQIFLENLADLDSYRSGYSESTCYPDYDAQTSARMLEEQEKDLELAAKIGQSLLERNKELQHRNEALEEQLNFSNEQVTQLKHELQMKIDLLHLYATSAVESESGIPNSSSHPWSLESLQQKVQLLEEENACLKLESTHLKYLTQGLEAREQQLVEDVLKQLAVANGQVDELSAELAGRSEECGRQKHEVTNLLMQLVDQQRTLKRLTYENEDLAQQMKAAQETQHELTQELMELQDRYGEVVSMLHEAQADLRHIREKRADFSGYESLFSELEDAIEQEKRQQLNNHNSTGYSTDRTNDSGYSSARERESSAEARAERRRRNEQLQECGDHIKAAMESVRVSAEKAAVCSIGSQIELLEITTATHTPAFSLTPRVDSGLGISPNSQLLTIAEHPHEEDPAVNLMSASVMTQNGFDLRRFQSTDAMASSLYPDGAEWGVPGIPGSKDLEAALQRLALRREANREWRRMRRERLQSAFSTPCGNAQPASNSHDKNVPALLPASGDSSNNSQSSGSNDCSAMSCSRSTTMFNLPGACKKHLQIVKPIQGSELLQQWKQFAAVGLETDSGTMLTPRKPEGIRQRGVRATPEPSPRNSGGSSDEDAQAGKRSMPTPGTYTYTTTTSVWKPSQNASGGGTATSGSSLSTSPDRKDPITSTFGTAMGLAKALGGWMTSDEWIASKTPQSLPEVVTPTAERLARLKSPVLELELGLNQADASTAESLGGVLIRADIATLPGKVGACAATKPPPYNPVKSRRNPVGSASISSDQQQH